MAVSAAQFEHCRSLLDPGVRIVEMTTDDSWMRDTGPTFVIDGTGRRRGVDWHFNAWGGLDGGLYFPWDRDDQVARKVLEIERADRYRAPIVLEGGSIHVDGEGTVLTTEQCLLNPNRNPCLSREEIERTLCAYLGAEKVVWLGEGVYNDETDGHIDNLACFVAPGVVALTVSDDPGDPQYAISQDAIARLRAATDARGRSFEVVALPSPGPILIGEDEAGGVDAVEGTLPRRAGRPARGVVRELLPRQPPRRLSRCSTSATTRRAAEILRRLFPRTRDRRCARAGDPARRRQHPLHHPAGAGGVSRCAGAAGCGFSAR